MESKKVKRVLTILFAALFSAIIIVFPSFSAIIQSHCKCHTYAEIYHVDPLRQNITANITSNIPSNITDPLT